MIANKSLGQRTWLGYYVRYLIELLISQKNVINMRGEKLTSTDYQLPHLDG